MRASLTAIFLTSCLISLIGVPQSRRNLGDPLAVNFAKPPDSARPRAYWWWLNGNTNAETITNDLEAMAREGFGGAILIDANGANQEGNKPVPAGPTFGSPEWTKLFLHTLKEAKRLGLEISLTIQSGWNLGGPGVPPEHAIKLLTWSQQVVTGGALPVTENVSQLQAPPQNLGFYRDIAVLAYPLHHGAALPGTADSYRNPIRDLKLKAVFAEAGFSTPDTKFLLKDFPAVSGEEDYKISEVRDITDHMTPSGALTWTPPPGKWEILRIGYTCSGAKVSTGSGAWQGLVIDYLDHNALTEYWNQNIEPMLKLARPYEGRSLRNVYTDSWEVGGVNWTGRFRAEFQQRRGYDLLPYLPVITGRIAEDRDTSDQFLNDFRRTIGDLVVAEHYGVFKGLAATDKLGFHPESGGPHGAPVDAIETLGLDTFPQSEYWAPSKIHRTSDGDRFFVKEASSAAHIYGKTLVAAEGMTSIGPQWEESVGRDLKPAIDQAFCEGLNLLFWHTFTSSPKSTGEPGQEYFAGTHFNPKITWFEDGKAFLAYIKRAQFMMQQGLPVSDVLYYYGDQVPNFVQVKATDPAGVMPGYDYDVVDEHILATGLQVREGMIVLANGTSYRELVLPPIPSASYVSLQAIQKLVNAGAVVVGKKPEHLTGLPTTSVSEATFEKLASEIWGNCDGENIQFRKVGAGEIVCGLSARETLVRNHIVPDFTTSGNSETSDFDYIHRRDGNKDIYFVRNTRGIGVHANLSFRVTGKQPELWSLETGAIVPQFLYSESRDGQTSLPIRLGPYGSTIVVFRSYSPTHFIQASRDGQEIFPASSATQAELTVSRVAGKFLLETSTAGTYSFTENHDRQLKAIVSRPEEVSLASLWHITFPAGHGAPPGADLTRLQSWTENTNPGIRYFSGTGSYTASFNEPSSMRSSSGKLFLNLGDVRETARVFINGHDLGVLWHNPYRVEITSAVHVGNNALRIEVTNLWPNRLIGDMLLPPEQRLTKTNITKFDKNSPLLPSGLIGPVSFEVMELASVKSERYR